MECTMGDVYDRNREIDEAIRAGERALDSLHEAQRQLHSAGNWGSETSVTSNI